MITFFIKILFEAGIAFLFGTLVFDFVHYLCHQLLKSRYKFIRILGAIHSPHHHFYPASLKVNKDWTVKNLLFHVTSEYIIQASATLSLIFFLDPFAIFLAELLQAIIFITVLSQKGIDHHHRIREKINAYRGGLFVDSEYHALHHLNPNKFYGSYTKIIDFILGTASQFAGKQIAITGANGALGRNMKRLLEKEGATIVTFKFGEDYTYDNYDQLREPLAKTDILLLCHGSKYDYAQEANCDSFIQIIELFKAVRKRDMVPVEIWGVGSEIECHPCFGIKKLKVYAESKRNFAKHARMYFKDKDIQYRHLVHSAFISPMGPGLMTANVAAKITLFLIKRGFKYVPVTYTGFALLNYLRFTSR